MGAVWELRLEWEYSAAPTCQSWDRLGGALGAVTDQIELHHSDLACTGQLEIGDLENRRAFNGSAACGWQLDGDLLRTRVKNDRGDLKRGRKLDRGDLEWGDNLHRRLALL